MRPIMPTGTHATTQHTTTEQEPLRTLPPIRGTALDYNMLDVEHVVIAQLIGGQLETFRDSA
jgi:hypothetical protein